MQQWSLKVGNLRRQRPHTRRTKLGCARKAVLHSGCAKSWARAIQATPLATYPSLDLFTLAALSTWPNCEKLFCAARFHSDHAGTLAAQTIKGDDAFQGDYKYFDAPKIKTNL